MNARIYTLNKAISVRVRSSCRLRHRCITKTPKFLRCSERSRIGRCPSLSCRAHMEICHQNHGVRHELQPPAYCDQLYTHLTTASEPGLHQACNPPSCTAQLYSPARTWPVNFDRDSSRRCMGLRVSSFDTPSRRMAVASSSSAACFSSVRLAGPRQPRGRRLSHTVVILNACQKTSAVVRGGGKGKEADGEGRRGGGPGENEVVSCTVYYTVEYIVPCDTDKLQALL